MKTQINMIPKKYNLTVIYIMQPEDIFTIINIVETYFEPCKTHRTNAYWLKNRVENDLGGVYTTLPEFQEIMREHGYYTNVKGSLKLKMKKNLVINKLHGKYKEIGWISLVRIIMGIPFMVG